jgi:hypothetical protein
MSAFSNPFGKRGMVRNKSAAERQITAEQLVREATERATVVHTEPVQKIEGEDELRAYQVRKRTEFENELRRERHHMGRLNLMSTRFISYTSLWIQHVSV